MRVARVVTVALLAGTVLFPASSAAHHLSYDTAEECMQSGSLMTGLPSCTRVGNGPWTASHPRDTAWGVDPASQARGAIGTILFIWLLMVAGSVWWVVATARRHGDPLGTALLGALVGGPLFVLMYVTNSDLIRRSRKLYRLTDRLPDGPPSSPPVPALKETSSRLHELTQLRDEGLITEDEFAARRRAIIDEV